MIHVVDFEKTAFSTSFRGVLAPSGPQISAESGSATHCLAPGKPGWPPTSNWPLFSRPTPHAPRLTLHAPPAGLGQAQTLPRRLLPDTDNRIGKDRTGPIWRSGPSIFSMSPKQTTPAEKSIRFSPLAAASAQPLNILSRAQTLNASASRRACRIAISRNARSFTDFPEFAQAVRYGVPGTHVPGTQCS